MRFFIDDPTLAKSLAGTVIPKYELEKNEPTSLSSWTIAINLPLTMDVAALAINLSDIAGATVVVTSPEKDQTPKDIAAFLVSRKIPTYAFASDDIQTQALQYKTTLGYSPQIILDYSYLLTGYSMAMSSDVVENDLKIVLETKMTSVPAFVNENHISRFNCVDYFKDRSLHYLGVGGMLFKAVDYYCSHSKNLGKCKSYNWDIYDECWK